MEAAKDLNWAVEPKEKKIFLHCPGATRVLASAVLDNSGHSISESENIAN
jgi:hypothetical protein